MSELHITLLALLFDWSIRFGILILGLMLWFRFKPPTSVYTRLFLGHLVLFAGLALPLTPRWWSIPWPTGNQWMVHPVSREPIQPEDSYPIEIVSRNHAPSIAAFSLTSQESPRAENTPSQTLPAQNTSPLEPVLSGEPSGEISRHWNLSWPAILAGTWALGVGFFLIRILAGIWWLGRIKRTSQIPSTKLLEEWEQARLALGFQRKIRLRESAYVATPALFGGWNPVVAIPLDWECEPIENRRAGFLHEWAHIQHRDDWAKTLDELIRSVFFFHPLVHWLLNQLGLDRELRCDALATRHGVSPRDLAEVLLAQVKKLGIGNSALIASPALSFFQPHSAKERIQKLLEADMKRWSEPLSRFRRLAMGLFILGITLGLGSMGILGATNPAEILAPTPEDKDLIEVRGNILMADGKPAAGAIVWGAKLDHSPLVRRETRADEKGQFQLSVPEGTWFFWARKDSQGGEGLNPANRRDWDISLKKKPNPFTIRMENRGWVRGRLTEEETGKPVVGGRIFIDNGHVATTDKEGKWELGGLSRTHHESFVVAKDRMRMRILFDTTSQPETQLDVPIPAGAKITGTVTDLEGKPIPNAWVGRYTSGSYFSLNGLFEPCDKDGRFEYFDAVQAGQPTRLVGGAPGYKPVEHNNIQVDPEKKTAIKFQLSKELPKDSIESIPGEKKKRIVTGSILGPDGKPVEGVLVRWGVMQTTESITTRSDRQGTFKLVAPDEDQILSVLPSQFSPQFLPTGKGGDKTLNVSLEKGHTVTGTVVDDQDKPIEGVMVVPVMAFPIPNICNQYWLDQNTGHTDASGRFSLKGIPQDCRFDFLKSNLSDLRSQELVLDQPTNTVRLSFGGAIKGKVVDSQGRPVPHFRVTVNAPKNRQPGDNSGGYFAGYCGMGVRFSSADGSFVLTGVGAGSVLRIQAYADGLGEAVVDRVTAVAINHLEKTPETIIKAIPPTPLNIQVKDKNGKPVPSALITLVDGQRGLDQHFSWGYHNASWENMIRGKTSSTGLVSFPSLGFKEATILVEAPGFARQRFGWRKGEKEFTVKMEAEAVLSGQLVTGPDQAGTEFYGTLMSQNGDQIPVSIRNQSEGRFLVKELPAGNWTLIIRSDRETDRSISQPVELKAGEVKESKVDWK